MSLLDALVLDSLLNPPVVTQEIWLANRSDAKGSGTQADPYQAGGASSDSDPIFDQLMRVTIVPGLSSKAMTVRLQPGTYYTKGWNSSYSGSQGWKPGSGLRIVGSGIGVTKLMLLPSNAGLTTAIGLDQASMTDFLAGGLEVSDLTIDANLAAGPTTSSVGGIAVNGANIFIRRVAVKNFGNKGTSPADSVAISAANAFSTTAAYQPYNCVVEGCSVQEPAGAAGNVIGYQLTSTLTGAYHLACVLRNNFADFGSGGTGANYFGLMAGGGIMTFVHSCQVRNALYGLRLRATSIAKDVVIQDNNFANVAKLLVEDYTGGAGPGIDRLILLKNVVEWPGASFGAPVGLLLDGNSGSSTTIFKEVIARGNVFRRPYGVTPTDSEVGLSFKNCSRVIVENNVTEVGTALNNGVRYSVCDKVKAFNNRKPDTTFFQAYDIANIRHLDEVTTDVEDALLAL
jgi:hypothetical protein